MLTLYDRSEFDQCRRQYNHKNMRTKDFLTRREQAIVYASPKVDVVNLRSEGVLCESFYDLTNTEIFDREGWDEL